MSLTLQQRATAVGLALLSAVLLLVVVAALVLEGQAVHAGGHATISELIWLVWAKQPWVVLLVSHVLAAPFWFLCGHFFGQASEVYDRIREQGL